MNKASQLVAVIAVGMLMPAMGYAEYSSSGPSASDSSAALDTIGGYTSALQGIEDGGKKSFSDGIQAKLKQVRENLKESQQELDNNGKISNWTTKIDKTKSVLALPDILMQGILNDREKQSQAITQAAGGLNRLTQGVDIQKPKTPACSDNVHFDQLESIATQLSSVPFQRLQQQVNEIMGAKTKADREAKAKSIMALYKDFEDAADRQQRQANVSQLDEKAKKSIVKDPYALKKRLAWQDDTLKKQKQEFAQLHKQVIKKVFTDLIPKLSKLNDNDKEMAKVMGDFTQTFENYRRGALKVAKESAAQLKSNCDAQAEALMGPGKLAQAYYAWAGEISGIQWASSMVAPGLSQVAQQTTCPDVSQSVQNLFGKNLLNAENALRNQTNPLRAMQSVSALVTQVANAQAQVGSVIQPLSNKCDWNAKQVKKVEQKIGQAQTQLAQQYGGQNAAAAGQGFGGFGGAQSLQQQSVPHVANGFNQNSSSTTHR